MNIKFSERLKELRTERGLTQENLSKALNYTQSNICEWERGTVEPKLSAIISMAKYFQVSVDFLLGISDEFETPLSASMEILRDDNEVLELFHEMSVGQKKMLIAYAEGLLGVETNSKMQRRKK